MQLFKISFWFQDAVAADPSASGTVVTEIKTEIKTEDQEAAKGSGEKSAAKVKKEPKEEEDEEAGPSKGKKGKSGGKKGKSGRGEKGEEERCKCCSVLLLFGVKFYRQMPYTMLTAFSHEMSFLKL